MHIVVPFRSCQPHLGASLSRTSQGARLEANSKCHGKRSCEYADLIITAFTQAILGEWNRNQQVDGLIQAHNEVPQLRSEGFAKSNVAAVFESMQGPADRARERRP